MSLDLLLPKDFDRDKLRWATVTDDSPLTIRLDGDASPMLGVPDTLVSPLAVADRVVVALVTNDDPARKSRRAIILGQTGGSDFGLSDDVADHETRLDAAEATLATLTGAWGTWSPSYTNLTIGAGGVVVARRRIIGKTCDWRWKFKLGSGSAVGTDPKITLPFTPHSSYVAGEDELGRGTLYNSGLTNRGAVARLDSGSTVIIVGWSSTGDHATISSTAPWTWGIDDVISLSGTNEVA